MASPADTRIAPIAPSTNPPLIQTGTFNPADWLARYTALGGVYVANGELNLCILVNHQSIEELAQLREMIAALTDDQKAAILAHIQATEAGWPTTWRDVVARYESDRDALTSHPYGRTLPDDPAYKALSLEADALAEAAEASLQKLVAAPAPDRAALRRKIEIAAAEYGEGFDVLHHVLADMNRLTAPATDDAILATWQRRVDAYRRHNLLPFSETDEPYTPEEAAEWGIIDRAEETIRSTVASTPAGVAAQLWTALGHMVTPKAQDDATMRQDLAVFDAIDGEMDWNVRLVLAALRSLKAMEAA